MGHGEQDARSARWTRHLRIRPWCAALLLGLAAAGWAVCVRMPGSSHRGPLPPLTPREAVLRQRLEAWLHGLASGVGPRSTSDPAGLVRAAALLEAELRALGLEVTRERFQAGRHRVENLVAEVHGRDPAAGMVLVGAHYDTYQGTSGANDNGSGVVALLHLAERFAGARPRRTLRLVLFTTEEPPHFQGPSMGSLVHATACADRGDDVRAMWSLESLAYYASEPGSQAYPFPLLGLVYPRRGDFVAFVGDLGSAALVRRCLGSFRGHVRFPSEGAVLPAGVPGVGWSDHWSFRQAGYPALMITDTAFFRDPAYHTPADTVERLDLTGLARVAVGLGDVLEELLEADLPVSAPAASTPGR